MGSGDWLKQKEKEKPQKVSKNTTGRESFNIGGVYIRKLALAWVLYWGGFLISYRILFDMYIFFCCPWPTWRCHPEWHVLPIPVYRQTDFTPKRVVVSHFYCTVVKFRTRVKFLLWYNNRGELTQGWLAPAWSSVVVSWNKYRAPRGNRSELVPAWKSPRCL